MDPAFAGITLHDIIVICSTVMSFAFVTTKFGISHFQIEREKDSGWDKWGRGNKKLI